MAIPIIIDTDMGIDDALAVCLALASDEIDVRAIVSVGGNVEAAQVDKNIAGLMAALAPPTTPVCGSGLSAPGKAAYRRELYGNDGLGDCGVSADAAQAQDFRGVYRRAIEQAKGELVILTTGPLTNIAAIVSEMPDLLPGIKRICISGGAVWAAGNATRTAEFNFHSDPVAAAKVISSGVPITVSPLDVTRFVCLDESHVARLAASGYRTGELAAKLLRHSIESDGEPGYGKTLIQDAVCAGSLLWPDLFLKTRMGLDVITTGDDAGRCRPALRGPSPKIDLLTAINAGDFLENMLESLCHEAFVV
jgi:inosine-uridine nucleoside N-ribohydrolase